MARLLRKRKESQAGERGNIKVRLGKVQERKIVHLVSLFLGLCEYCCYNRGGGLDDGDFDILTLPFYNSWERGAYLMCSKFHCKKTNLCS